MVKQSCSPFQSNTLTRLVHLQANALYTSIPVLSHWLDLSRVQQIYNQVITDGNIHVSCKILVDNQLVFKSVQYISFVCLPVTGQSNDSVLFQTKRIQLPPPPPPI